MKQESSCVCQQRLGDTENKYKKSTILNQWGKINKTKQANKIKHNSLTSSVANGELGRETHHHQRRINSGWDEVSMMYVYLSLYIYICICCRWNTKPACCKPFRCPCGKTICPFARYAFCGSKSYCFNFCNPYTHPPTQYDYQHYHLHSRLSCEKSCSVIPRAMCVSFCGLSSNL